MSELTVPLLYIAVLRRSKFPPVLHLHSAVAACYVLAATQDYSGRYRASYGRTKFALGHPWTGLRGLTPRSREGVISRARHAAEPSPAPPDGRSFACARVMNLCIYILLRGSRQLMQAAPTPRPLLS